jgi:hypothetical protein
MRDEIDQWTEIADAIGQAALDILGGKPVTMTQKSFADPRVLAVMIMSRSLSNFRGVFLLVESGLIVEARALVRCCFENTFWLAGLLADGDAFVKQMRQDEMRSRKARGELVLRKRTAALSKATEEKIREQLRLIKKRWPTAKRLSPKDVALKGVLSEGYLIYIQLSADAAHPTFTSLSRHIGQRADGEKIIDVVPAPRGREPVETLDWACNATLGACAAVNEILGGTPAGQQLNTLADRYGMLRRRNRDRHDGRPR